MRGVVVFGEEASARVGQEEDRVYLGRRVA